MSFPETVDEILDVSEDEGRVFNLITLNTSTVQLLIINFQL